jgi:hypothetical protein
MTSIESNSAFEEILPPILDVLSPRSWFRRRGAGVRGVVRDCLLEHLHLVVISELRESPVRLRSGDQDFSFETTDRLSSRLVHRQELIDRLAGALRDTALADACVALIEISVDAHLASSGYLNLEGLGTLASTGQAEFSGADPESLLLFATYGGQFWGPEAANQRSGALRVLAGIRSLRSTRPSLRYVFTVPAIAPWLDDSPPELFPLVTVEKGSRRRRRVSSRA